MKMLCGKKDVPGLSHVVALQLLQ